MPEVALCECYAAVPDRRTHQFTDLEASTVLASLALRLSARSQLAAGNCSSRPLPGIAHRAIPGSTVR